MPPKNPTDRRRLRTKKAIRDAFIALIEEKGFDAILVSDIAERANINRGTFYLHYQDKFDLLDKSQTEIIDNIERIILHTDPLNLTGFTSFDKPLPIIVSIFEYIKENADFMHAIFNLEGGVRLQNQIRNTVEKNFRLQSYGGLREKNFLLPSHYMISYAVSAHLGVIHEWLEGGCKESPEEMTIFLSKISWFGLIRSFGIPES